MQKLSSRLIISSLLMILITSSVIAQEDVPFGTDPVPMIPEVINVYSHDSDAFTQGFLINEDGNFFESTGLFGESTLREVDVETGEVLRSVDVDEAFFAEGLEFVDDRLVQLTWQSGKAFVYDPETFEPIAEYEYEGEGWGLCATDDFLYMSDGSPFIQLRDKETFDLIFKGVVWFGGGPIQENLLNELECVGDKIYANLWQTDFIVEIDMIDGHVTSIINAAGLLTEEETAALGPGGTLNGIAYNKETETFFITGKLWPQVFEVRFVPSDN